jgi:hypothetical protein
MDIVWVYIDNFLCEIQEQKEVPVCYMGPFRALLLLWYSVFISVSDFICFRYVS